MTNTNDEAKQLLLEAGCRRKPSGMWVTRTGIELSSETCDALRIYLGWRQLKLDRAMSKAERYR